MANYSVTVAVAPRKNAKEGSAEGEGAGKALLKNCEAEFRNFTLYLENCY